MKTRIIRFLSRLGSWLLKRKGVRVGQGLILSGLPQIKLAKGASITIGNGVTIHSMPRMNPVMTNRSFLAAMLPGSQITIGNGVGMSGATVVCLRQITIGANTLLGADCLLLDSDMHYPLKGSKWGSTLFAGGGDTPLRAAPINIGKGCFLGARSIILKGVTVGNGAVVAAGTVVTKDVPPAHLAFGNPMQLKPLPPAWIHPPADS